VDGTHRGEKVDDVHDAELAGGTADTTPPMRCGADGGGPTESI
jgi:hypothetical protein